MVKQLDIQKFDLNEFETWAPVVGSFLANQNPAAPAEFYQRSDIFETGPDAAHYGLFIEEGLAAVAGLCRSRLGVDQERYLYILAGEREAETPKELLLRYVERETHRANFPLLTALVSRDEYAFYQRNGYRRRKVDPDRRPDDGLLFICKYIWVDQVARVRFARSA